MIGLASIPWARLWLEPSSIAALQRPDDDLISRIFSLVFLAFVLLWPVIQRKINEAQQRQREEGGGARPERPDPTRRDALEDLFGGSAPEVESEGPEPWRGARAREPESDAPPPLPPGAGGGRSFGGDPFDDSSMEDDLVPETSLPDTPRESELERGRFDEDAAAATLRRASFRSTPLSGGSSVGQTASGRGSSALGSSLSTGLSSGVGVGAGSGSREATRAALRRLERRYSHWQRAFVLREVLGPPRSAQLFDDPRR